MLVNLLLSMRIISTQQEVVGRGEAAVRAAACVWRFTYLAAPHQW